MGMQVHNVDTNIVGRTQFQVRCSAEEWDKAYWPLIQRLLGELSGGKPFEYKAQVGYFAIQFYGTDEHVAEFYKRNWPEAAGDAKIDGYCINLVGVTDPDTLRILKNLHSREDEEAALAKMIEMLNAAGGKYKKMFRDEGIRHMDEKRKGIDERIEIMLSSPSAIYCPEKVTYCTVNTNYYGESKTRATLGPLDDWITDRIETTPDGEVKRPGEISLSLHAGCVIYRTNAGEDRGVIIIAPTGTGKSTNCYGLVDAKPECKLVADDFGYVNLGSLEVIYSEDNFYMRTNIAENYPHLVPWLISQPLENVAFTRETRALIERFDSPEQMHDAIKHGLASEDEIKDMMRASQLSRDEVEDLIAVQGRISYTDYDRLIDEMCYNPAARSIIDPRVMVGPEKFATRTTMADVLLGKRDYDDAFVLRQLDADETVTILTSNDNVFNYDEKEVDDDGYPVLRPNTTEIYYDPYLCTVDVNIDPAKGIHHVGPLDVKRIAAWRHLAADRRVRVAWVNTRLPAPQTQFSLRKYMEGECDDVYIIKGIEIANDLVEILGLVKQPKQPVEGRRAIDLVGLYEVNDGQREEVEVVGYFRGSGSGRTLVEAVAFTKRGRGLRQIRAWSKGAVDKFIDAHKHMGVRTLFSA
jgi:hypothetical protein